MTKCQTARRRAGESISVWAKTARRKNPESTRVRSTTASRVESPDVQQACCESQSTRWARFLNNSGVVPCSKVFPWHTTQIRTRARREEILQGADKQELAGIQKGDESPLATQGRLENIFVQLFDSWIIGSFVCERVVENRRAGPVCVCVCGALNFCEWVFVCVYIFCDEEDGGDDDGRRRPACRQASYGAGLGTTRELGVKLYGGVWLCSGLLAARCFFWVDYNCVLNVEIVSGHCIVCKLRGFCCWVLTEKFAWLMQSQIWNLFC